ncbi:ESCRT-III subunit protein VPS24 [Nakaseomyces bracarensis]|uniref:ESCRT-III subunit protein VPS24 n=1 Tax=Nakaseomyces bracarensis TaxID=273131 RepID=UPI0038729DE0
MDYVKNAIWGPDIKEQQRNIKSLLRKNSRQIDKSLRELSVLQNKTQALIKKSAKKNDVRNVRLYAKELYYINKQYTRMYTSKAQLESVSMKIDEAFRMRTLSNQMANSTGLMREVNSLVRLPQLQGTMVELEKELMKSGIISEMIDDTMESIDDTEELNDEVDAEVNKIVEQYTTEKLEKADNVPTTELSKPVEETEQEVPEDEIEDEADKMLNEMRDRLRALQN